MENIAVQGAGAGTTVRNRLATQFMRCDSIWDTLAATRCGTLGVGLVSGGYGLDEWQQSGAIRLYEDPADLLAHIDEVGGLSGCRASAECRSGPRAALL